MNSGGRPYTPDQLAELWGCSPNHVRNLIRQGDLRAFRLGARLLRVPADAVHEFEARQMMTPQPLDTGPGVAMPIPAIVITHARERQRKRD